MVSFYADLLLQEIIYKERSAPTIATAALRLKLECFLIVINTTNYRPQCSCGKVMFSQASVILTGGGGVAEPPPPPDGYCSGMHSCFTYFYQ